MTKNISETNVINCYWIAYQNRSSPHYVNVVLCKMLLRVAVYCYFFFFVQHMADAIHTTENKTVCAELEVVKVTFARMVTIVYRISHFCFICCAVGSLQYSKCVWTKVGAPTVHIFISIFLSFNVNPIENILTLFCCFYFYIFYPFKSNLCYSICKSNTPWTSVIWTLNSCLAIDRHDIAEILLNVR
jgi:hypothetical protein